MKISLVSVGGPSKLLDASVRDYEQRASRYWKLEITDVKAEKASRNRPITEVRQAEGERLLAAVPAGADLVALTRGGETWSSERLARYLNELAVAGSPGAAFVIGGAYGLDRQLLRSARYQLSLSSLTMPHDLARLVFAEQLYRAGTILRGEPYHKG